MTYLQVPQTITYRDFEKTFLLSPSGYKRLNVLNKNIYRLGELISNYIKGKATSRKNFITTSNKFLITNSALQSDWIISTRRESAIIPVTPYSFISDNSPESESILLATNANVGASALSHLKENNNYMLSPWMISFKLNQYHYYVFAFLKSDFFLQQIEFLVPRGATLRNATKELFNAVIPFPNQKNRKEVIEFVNLLTKAVIRKELEIKEKYDKTMELIDKELKENQKPNQFIYDMPSLEHLQKTARLDAGMFCKDYKEKQFLIENYIYSAENIFNNFDFKRGQNLQVSQIGRSIYSEEYKPNFYKLIRPLNLSDFGTVEKYEYLGNPRRLQTINKGEILFSAEGTIGKFCVFIDVDDKTITNIHGITIFRKDKEDDIESIFLGLFLGYLRKSGILDYISVGGQGGSLAQRYWNYIKIPNFPRSKKEELAKYYYNSVNYDKNKLNLIDFETEDFRITKESGIWQLDKQIKQIKQKLKETLHKIVIDEEVQISFYFLSFNNPQQFS